MAKNNHYAIMVIIILIIFSYASSCNKSENNNNNYSSSDDDDNNDNNDVWEIWERQLDDYPVEYCDNLETGNVFKYGGSHFLFCDYELCKEMSGGCEYPPNIIDPVIPNPECTIILNMDGKTWNICGSAEGMPYECALCYVNNIEICGYSDWRFPTIDELASLYDPTNETNIDDYGIISHIRKPFKILSFVVWSGNENDQSDEVEVYDYYQGEKDALSEWQCAPVVLIVRP